VFVTASAPIEIEVAQEAPLVQPFIGGLVTSTLLTLFVLRTVYAWIAKQPQRQANDNERTEVGVQEDLTEAGADWPALSGFRWKWRRLLRCRSGFSRCALQVLENKGLAGV